MKTKKSLGQHFLHSPQIIADIVSAGKVTSGDTVVEVGPGEGTLTEALLQTGANIVSIEKDDRLIPVLEEKFRKEISSEKLRLIHGDILDFKISQKNLGVKNSYKVVANIPYYITGQIIRMFLESDYKPESMTLLVQKEVAERIVAKDGKESLLSLSVKVFGEPRYVRKVGRGAFSPQPNVDSAVLSVVDISNKRLGKVAPELFFHIIHIGFAHKRKQLIANLSLVYDRESLIKIFTQCGIAEKARAEDLSLETWIQLCTIISK